MLKYKYVQDWMGVELNRDFNGLFSKYPILTIINDCNNNVYEIYNIIIFVFL